MTGEPVLTRRISLLDIDWTEKIVVDALREIFIVFRRVLNDHKSIVDKKSQIIQNRKKFHKKSDKEQLKALNEIIAGFKNDEEESKNEVNGQTV